MAEGALHSVGIVAETTFGETPASPTFETFRQTGATLALNKEALTSAELRDDRQIACMRSGVRAVGGDLSFELSYGGEFDTLLEAALCGTWATGTLKAGTTRRSFSVERKYGDYDGSALYHLFTGVEFNTFSLSIAPNAIVTGSAGVMGNDMGTGTASAGTTNAPTTQCPFESFTGTIKEGGSTIGIVTELSLSLDNGMQAKNVIGSAVGLQPSIGRSSLTGQLTAYFEDNTLLDKFVNDTNSSIEFSLTDGTGTYAFTLPNIKYSGGATDVSGEGPVTLPMPFTALYDTTSDSQIVVTK